MTASVTVACYLLCAVVYAFGAGILAGSRAQHKYKILLIAACVLTATWAAVIGTAPLLRSPPPSLPLIAMILEQLHYAGWIAVIALALLSGYKDILKSSTVVGVAALTGAMLIYNIAILALQERGVVIAAMAWRGMYLAHVLVEIVALLSIENLFRNSDRERRWSVKYLCFGLGIVFSYDLFIYAQAALLNRLDVNEYAARGVVTALALPLLILSFARSRSWPIDVHVSRSFVFHSVTLLASGAYLIVMSVAGYSLRVFGGEWGTISQVAFFIAAMLVLAIVLSSGGMQERLRNFISHNFFSYRYDYRNEWLRFIDSISDSANGLTIPERVVHALANIIGSTSGGIWVRRDEDKVFHRAGNWNLHDVPTAIPTSDPLIEILAKSPDVIAVGRRQNVVARDVSWSLLPEWIGAHPQILIVLPLRRSDDLIAFAVLGEMRAPRAFDWEDFELLRTAARQAASYVAEDLSAQALERVRRFEEFNRRFAFIVHDIKNLAGQMSLILQNADRHGDNPEFQRDMFRTLRESVTRLRGMFEQLKNPESEPKANPPVELVRLLNELVATWKLQIPGLQTDLPIEPVFADGNADGLRAIVNHLVQNAMDAAGPDARIGIELHVEGTSRTLDGRGDDGKKMWAVISVVDDGPGMEQSFIESGLFEPLRSRKKEGFGIGAFQARQIVRDMGGSLKVESTSVLGTRMNVRIPYVVSKSTKDAEAASDPVRGILKPAE
jgi:putative PEP-CTERM system histidine kinase